MRNIFKKFPKKIEHENISMANGKGAVSKIVYYNFCTIKLLLNNFQKLCKRKYIKYYLSQL